MDFMIIPCAGNWHLNYLYGSKHLWLTDPLRGQCRGVLPYLGDFKKAVSGLFSTLLWGGGGGDKDGAVVGKHASHQCRWPGLDFVLVPCVVFVVIVDSKYNMSRFKFDLDRRTA